MVAWILGLGLALGWLVGGCTASLDLHLHLHRHEFQKAMPNGPNPPALYSQDRGHRQEEKKRREGLGYKDKSPLSTYSSPREEERSVSAKRNSCPGIFIIACSSSRVRACSSSHVRACSHVVVFADGLFWFIFI